MPSKLDRAGVQRLVSEEAAQLVEVLPRGEYDEEHLDGAIHIPLKQLDAAATEVLDRSRAVIVYCWDSL